MLYHVGGKIFLRESPHLILETFCDYSELNSTDFINQAIVVLWHGGNKTMIKSDEVVGTTVKVKDER